MKVACLKIVISYFPLVRTIVHLIQKSKKIEHKMGFTQFVQYSSMSVRWEFDEPVTHTPSQSP